LLINGVQRATRSVIALDCSNRRLRDGPFDGSVAGMPEPDTQPSPEPSPLSTAGAVRVARVFAAAFGALSGVTINVVSNDLAYRWTGVLWAVLAVLFSGWWLSRHASAARATRWFPPICCASALLAAIASLYLPTTWTAYVLVVAAALGCTAALAATPDALPTLSMGILSTAAGVGLAAHGLAGGGFAGVVRVVCGTGLAVAGLALIVRRVRVAGIVVSTLGVFSLAVALVLVRLGGSAILMALVFGSLAAGGILVGSVMTSRRDNVQDAAGATTQLIAASISLLYFMLGAVALRDGRFLLAAADIGGALIIGVAVAASYLRSGVDLFLAMSTVGPALLVDGIETASRGQPMAGMVQAAGGVMALGVLATRLRGPVVTLWHYAMSPAPDARQPSALDDS
jgi:hypothetical protein